MTTESEAIARAILKKRVPVGIDGRTWDDVRRLAQAHIDLIEEADADPETIGVAGVGADVLSAGAIGSRPAAQKKAAAKKKR
jgi:hypothetical protein